MQALAVLDTALVSRRLAELRLGRSQVHKALTLWPVLPTSRGAGDPPWLALVEALEDGLAGVAANPWDPGAEAFVSNRGPRPVLVVAGEALGGGPGALLAAESVLVPPRAELAVPAAEGKRRAHGDLAERPCVRAAAGQVGLVTALGDQVLGLDLVGHPRTLAACLPALLARHFERAASKAFGCAPRGAARRPRFDAPEALLEALARTPVRVRPTPGLGRTLELGAQGVRARALVAAGELVHLAARV